MQKAQEGGQEDKKQTTPCKRCKSSLDVTYVVDSRTHKGVVRRRRRCRLCDTKIYTEEKIIAVGETPWSARRGKRSETPVPKLPRKQGLKPKPKEIINEPDFDKMTDEEIESWIVNQE